MTLEQRLELIEKKLDQTLLLLGEKPASHEPVEIPTPTSYQLRCQEALAREAASKARKNLREQLRCQETLARKDLREQLRQ